jgi:hypothetical protein
MPIVTSSCEAIYLSVSDLHRVKDECLPLESASHVPTQFPLFEMLPDSEEPQESDFGSTKECNPPTKERQKLQPWPDVLVHLDLLHHLWCDRKDVLIHCTQEWSRSYFFIKTYFDGCLLKRRTTKTPTTLSHQN